MGESCKLVKQWFSWRLWSKLVNRLWEDSILWNLLKEFELRKQRLAQNNPKMM